MRFLHKVTHAVNILEFHPYFSHSYLSYYGRWFLLCCCMRCVHALITIYSKLGPSLSTVFHPCKHNIFKVLQKICHKWGSTSIITIWSSRICPPATWSVILMSALRPLTDPTESHNETKPKIRMAVSGRRIRSVLSLLWMKISKSKYWLKRIVMCVLLTTARFWRHNGVYYLLHCFRS